MNMLMLSFNSPSTSLEIAGGKGANLSSLAKAGFNVPRGMILGTAGYKEFVALNRLQISIQAALQNKNQQDPEALELASADIRNAFAAGQLPQEIETALESLITEWGGRPLAVRSSATTEDLPDLSFAGQQDTFLNVLGAAQLKKAVIDCWSSLWTARAIGYRTRSGIPHEQAALAVVIQQMIQSEVSGVMFTANPISGQRRETAIDATFGLGEALVAGKVDPDHYLVDSLTGEIRLARLGAKQVAIRAKDGGGVATTQEDGAQRQSLSAEMARELTKTGQAIQQLFGGPQDIEWAFADGRLHILQARPITSLFPVPEISFDPLEAWFSFGAVQGLVGPLTPLGQDTILYVAAAGGGLFGQTIKPNEIKFFRQAGERLWIKMSDLLRNPLGSRVLPGIFDFIEPSVGRIITGLALEPETRFGLGGFKLSTLRSLAQFALPVLMHLIHNMLRPGNVQAGFDQFIDEQLASAHIPVADNPHEQLRLSVKFMREHTVQALALLLPKFIPVLGPAMGGLNALKHLSPDPGLALEVTRSLPRNVTTEMDLSLWQTARTILADPHTSAYFQAAAPGQLSRLYLQGSLPGIAQQAIAHFLDRYGMRGVGEIDIGQPRWRDDPTAVMHTLQSYLNTAPESAPDLTFARGEQSALAAIEKIASSVRSQPAGWLKEKIVRAAARRIRLLMGARESPKFFIIRLMGVSRKSLLLAGQGLAQAGQIQQADDLVFLTLDELAQLAQEKPGATDWKTLVASRRAIYAREMRRRQVPRVLISDGRAMYEGLAPEGQGENIISGSPVSPGQVTGVVHIVLDPRGTHLVPGEILVCPGTDPAWTPLFLVAGGLITEVGGMMTHGSVVAREYGIPAVVGVHAATTRLRDGQRISMDGTSGKIVILDP